MRKIKKIEAYIQPFMLQHVEDALRAICVPGMTVIKAKGFGSKKEESFPPSTEIDFTVKTKIEIICQDSACDRIVEAIQKNARTGRIGDGKIIIYTIEEAVSILTGEKGEKAI